MSNTITGAIFGQIIERVVVASQNDFEESGVDQQTLQEMKEIWQKKLSALHVAQMPWDPAPPPPMQISNPPTVPSNDSSKAVPQQMQPPASQPPHQYAQNAQAGGPRVKTEPGYPPNMSNYQMNGYGSMNGSNIAQQRAAQLLQQNYGDQANASIASAYPQNNVGLPGQQHQQHQQQRPMNLQMPPNRQQQQQHAAQHPPQQPQQQQQQGPPSQNPHQQQSSVYAAQTDGAGDADLADWKALVASRRAEAAGDLGAMHAADGMLRAQFEQRMDVIESGLMQPLEELPSSKGKGKKRRSAAALARATAAASSSSSSVIPQLDGELGVDDDAKPEENDDEAINSDLDDSDEEQIQGEEEDGPQGDTMICTYDKVQRVKNKWKCTLKDGILSTGGKDYLFHKAQGEFEW
ncbi:transcription factor IIA, alpha/beta subunit [Phyllosticta citrichinensis]|uniref:Transcription factor IIA, alpha/beta subunit n=1 Tax=Phyllosticta citrichinensis TaxID=1130410 RepID=A0ABR1XPX0_9PEZI